MALSWNPLRWFRRAEEKRSISFQDVWGSGGPTPQHVSQDKALRLGAVYSAVRLLADNVASMPLKEYNETAQGSPQELRLSSLFKKPASHGTIFDWKHRAVVSLALRGNLFGIITSVDAGGYATQVEWVHPEDVSIEDNLAIYNPVYYFRGRPIKAGTGLGELLHIPGFTLPGQVMGISPIRAYAMTVETGLSAQEFGRDWFANGSTPSAVLETDQPLDAEKGAIAKDRFKQAASGRDVVALGAGLTYKPISVPAEESQFLETIKATASQIAHIYGIPPERIGGETGKSLTYSNVEQDSIDFVQFTLDPLLARLEEAFETLLPGRRYVRFNRDARIRTDVKTRYQVHRVSREIGLRNIDEIRALEDLPPLPNGEGQDYTPLRQAAAGEDQNPDDNPQGQPDESS